MTAIAAIKAIPAKAIPGKIDPVRINLLNIARNGPAIMSAPCESRQFSHPRALAEARGEVSGSEFHPSGGNWRNNSPELRREPAFTTKCRQARDSGAREPPRAALPDNAALFRAQKCRIFRMEPSLRLIS
ncbi:MAG: hypothetical protein L0I29_18385 [Hyphomicrobiales bacterium]|nr:hypothetical protein [Hyphomicrobiales bacterium]